MDKKSKGAQDGPPFQSGTALYRFTILPEGEGGRDSERKKALQRKKNKRGLAHVRWRERGGATAKTRFIWSGK